MRMRKVKVVPSGIAERRLEWLLNWGSEGMSDWIKAINPTGPITNEAEASMAARASALSIVIGVVVGIISLVWTLLNPQDMQAAADAASTADSPAAGAATTQLAIWLGGAMIAVQAVFAFIQWRDPKKWIAILFLVLLAYGIVSTVAAPALAGMVPNMPAIPVWQIALSLVIMVVQVVLHVAGLRGIGRLDAIQMDAAR